MSQILPNLAQENEALRKQVEALQAQALLKRTISFKISEKGALSIYGLGRFPVTLYLSQFESLNAAWPKVQAFVEANRAAFKVKE
jgi:hypothetical protein